MIEKLSIHDLIDRIAERNKVTKKLSEEWLRLLPEVIEEGLLTDGYVKVRGLGTFRLKWVEKRIARNLKTGTEVEVPAHSRVIFQAEKKVKDLINEEYKYLSYSVIDEEGKPEESPGAKAGTPIETVPSRMEIATPPPAAEKASPPPVPPAEKVREARKKYYWIIPVTFLVIIILAILFYLRNCTHKAEYSKPGLKEQVIAPADQEEGISQQAPESYAGMEADSLKEADATMEDETPDQPAVAEPIQKPMVQTPEKIIVTKGEWLFQLAREHYGNPFLWVLIYQANREHVSNPDNLPSGLNLVIPGLEGTPRNLSRNDSSRVADGYRLVYEYYYSKGDQRADGFYQEVKKYTPR